VLVLVVKVLIVCLATLVLLFQQHWQIVDVVAQAEQVPVASPVELDTEMVAQVVVVQVGVEVVVAIWVAAVLVYLIMVVVEVDILVLH
jgi:multisubunit Na+/H+ antiporter MnhB subunit